MESTEAVRIDKSVVELVRKDKETTGVPIGKFFELSAKEKLSKQKKK